MAPSVLLVNDGNVVNAVEDSPSTAENPEATGKSLVLHRSLHSDPLHVIGAQGHYLHLSNGQRILDASGGAAVACLGHAETRVQQALIEQMNQVSYCHSLFYATHAAEDLASLLISSTYNEMARAFFISSGSEAMEAALKLARQYHLEKVSPEPQRVHFISRQQSYHGATLGALAAGGHVARRAIFEPILSANTSRVSPCYPYRGLDDTVHSEDEYVRCLETELDAEFHRLRPDTVAAFIAEPVVGAALGCVPPCPGYFKAVRRVCDKYGALLIFDEVMSGTGRVGPEPSEKYPEPLHAWQDPVVGVVPDIMTMGKGLGGGYMPIAATLASQNVVDVLQRGSGAFSHGQTYQGHPLACRAGLEVQRIIKERSLVSNVREQGALLGRLLGERLQDHPSVGNVRGKGLFWGIEFVQNKATKKPFHPALGVAMKIHELGMEKPHSISLYPGTGCADGRNGDHIILAPAYTVTSEDIRQIVDITVAVIEKFFSGLLPTHKDHGTSMKAQESVPFRR